VNSRPPVSRRNSSLRRRHRDVSQPNDDRARLFGLPQAHRGSSKRRRGIARLPLRPGASSAAAPRGRRRMSASECNSRRRGAVVTGFLSRSIRRHQARSSLERPPSTGGSARSSRGNGLAVAHAQRAEPRERRWLRDRSRHEKARRLERDPRRAGDATFAGAAASSKPFSPERHSGTTSPRHGPGERAAKALSSPRCPRSQTHRQAAPRRCQLPSGHQYQLRTRHEPEKNSLGRAGSPSGHGSQFEGDWPPGVATLSGRFSWPSARNRFTDPAHRPGQGRAEGVEGLGRTRHSISNRGLDCSGPTARSPAPLRAHGLCQCACFPLRVPQMRPEKGEREFTSPLWCLDDQDPCHAEKPSSDVSSGRRSRVPSSAASSTTSSRAGKKKTEEADERRVVEAASPRRRQSTTREELQAVFLESDDT